MSQANTAGWYPDPDDGRRRRYWDGDDWDGPSVLPPPASPWTWVGGGVSGLLLASILVAVGEGGDGGPLTIVAALGYVVVLISAIAIAVGVIGAGVRLGMRHARWDEE